MMEIQICLQGENRLLQADYPSQQTLEDAEKRKHIRAMRNLFDILLRNVEIRNPSDLWDQFKCSISEDCIQHERRAANNLNFLNNEGHQDQALLYFLLLPSLHHTSGAMPTAGWGWGVLKTCCSLSWPSPPITFSYCSSDCTTTMLLWHDTKMDMSLVYVETLA